MSPPDPIYDSPSVLPDAVSAGAKQLVEKARQLGLVWTLRLASVSVATLDNLSVIFDGDTASLSVTNISGEQVVAGDRVYVMIVPPAGNFIIGRPGSAVLGNGCNTVTAATAGTTTSATFVTQPGSPSVTITKRYSATRLRVTWAQTFYVTGATAGATFGVSTTSFGGSSAFLAVLNTANGALNTHTPISGVTNISGIDAGTAAWTGAWARASGAGTLNVDANDFWSMCIEEFWPSD